jgi:translation initiation factor 4E
LKMLGVHSTVESFFGTFSTLRRPSHLEKGSNYHLFKDGIKPMWEDKQNANGGKWTLTLKGTNNPALLDRSWMWLVLALIGEELDPENMLTGAVVSVRPKGDRLSIWTRSKEDVDKLNELAKRFVSILDLEKEPGVGLEFSYNTGQALPQPNAFWHFYNPPHHGHAHHGLHGGAPTGRQHSAGGFGSPAVSAGVLSPPSGPAGGRFSTSGSGVLRRGSDNPFASTQKLVAPGSSPSKGSSVLGRASSTDSHAEGPRPVLGSASPVKRGGPLPT